MTLEELLAAEPIAAPTLNGGSSSRLTTPDPDTARRNRNNRKRGKGTSRDLADFLGWQNVEGMNWPWDIQDNHGRIQSKRDNSPRGPVAALALIERIPAGDWLRGLYWVAPRGRLTSGTVTVLLQEWVEWHGWTMPKHGTLSVAVFVPLLTMPLPVFADVDGRRA